MSFSTLSHHAPGVSVSPHTDFRSCTRWRCSKPNACDNSATRSQWSSGSPTDPCKKAVFASAVNTRIPCDPATVKKSCRSRRVTVGDAVRFAHNCGSVNPKTTKRASRLESGFRVITTEWQLEQRRVSRSFCSLTVWPKPVPASPRPCQTKPAKRCFWKLTQLWRI